MNDPSSNPSYRKVKGAICNKPHVFRFVAHRTPHLLLTLAKAKTDYQKMKGPTCNNTLELQTTRSDQSSASHFVLSSENIKPEICCRSAESTSSISIYARFLAWKSRMQYATNPPFTVNLLNRNFCCRSALSDVKVLDALAEV
jgi:hypothetical protein